MTQIISITILIILFGIFLFWAYLPDYKRNPKEFWRVLIGMPFGIFFSGIGFRGLNKQIKEWTVRKENRKGKIECLNEDTNDKELKKQN